METLLQIVLPTVAVIVIVPLTLVLTIRHAANRRAGLPRREQAGWRTLRSLGVVLLFIVVAVFLVVIVPMMISA